MPDDRPKTKRRRPKPKVLLLSNQSERSIFRLMGAMALAEFNDAERRAIRSRAIDILTNLKAMT